MTKLKKYDSYKNSGVDWLGEIPEHWEVKRLGFYFIERREKVSDKIFQPLSVTKNGIMLQLENAAKTNDGDNRKRVCKGDFVINSRSDRKGSSGLSSLNGSVSLINTVLEPIFINEYYSHYLLKSYLFQEEYYRNGKGIVADLWSTNYSEMKNIIIPFPPIQEQQKIAQFLDEKTDQIDQAVAQKQKLIELLKEQKRIVINEAVTKGLDKNVELKESGIDWIGKIPKHWEVNKLKNVVNNKTVKSKESDFKIGLENIESFTSKYIETTENIFSEAGINFSKGDVLFGKLRPYLAKVYLTEQNGLCVSEFLVLESKNIHNQYLKFLLLSSSFLDYVNGSTYGTKMPRANWDFVGNSKIPLPLKPEQQQIADYLDSKIMQIDNFIALTQKQIDKLKEYKTVLIDNVVTGKVRVA